MRCERCGSSEGAEQLGSIVLCEDCVALILKEWKLRRDEFAELTVS
jgi:hypothetical protein